MTPSYRKNLNEAQHHFEKMREAFTVSLKDPALVHSLNAFLSAAQSVF